MEETVVTLEKAYDMASVENAYRQYSAECDCGMALVLARINNIQKQLDILPERNPIAYIESRVKTFGSVARKCYRRGFVKEGEALTIDVIKEHVRDIAGIRVTTTFKDDVIRICDEITHQPGINVVEKKNYIDNPKPNGYSSFHLQIQVEIYSSAEQQSKLVPVEIQIRDRAQDLWATIEHIVAYKNQNKSPEAEKLFKRIADTLDSFDQLAIELRDYQPESTSAKKSEKPSDKKTNKIFQPKPT